MQSPQVISICNALVDILVKIDHDEFKAIGIEKGVMHLVDSERQHQLLKRFSDHPLTYELGGSAMNTTRALAALGIGTAFFGSVGDDDFGNKIVSRMRELNIESHVAITAYPTGSCAILITPDGERTMNTDLGASLRYDRGMVPHKHIEKAELLYVTGYQWSTEHQRHAVYDALDTALKSDTTIAIDMADPFIVRAYGKELRDVITRYADIVFCNKQEAEDLFDTTVEEAGAWIRAQGAIGAMKRGAEGALIFANDRTIAVPVVPTKVVDTTAAGDMFAAGFVYGYLNGKSPEICGKMAVTLAADVISHIGAVISPTALQKVKAL